MSALQENINLFYSPTDLKNNPPASDRSIRAGGLVKEKSLMRNIDSLEIYFEITDLKNTIAVLLRSKNGTIYQAQKFMLDRNSRSKTNNEICLHENIAQPNSVHVIFHTYKGSEVKNDCV